MVGYILSGILLVILVAVLVRRHGEMKRLDTLSGRMEDYLTGHGEKLPLSLKEDTVAQVENAAEEMQIPRYLLSIWLKQSGRHYSEWLAELRIQEAKRTLRDHPEWSNEAVAQHCGFSDRCYFQKVFKEMTGMTPAQFLTL